MAPVCVCVGPACPGCLLDRYKFIFRLVLQFDLLNFVESAPGADFSCIFGCLQTCGKKREGGGNILQPTDGERKSLGTNRSAFGERRGVEEEEEGDSD